MTLSSRLCKVIHQIDPATKRYSFPFKIFKKPEAAVWILGPDGRESSRLRLDGDYLISGLANDSGGEISLTESGQVQAANGHSLLIIRNMDFTQDLDYLPHDIFPAHSHERALDILTMQNQELLEMLKRAALVPVGRQAADPWGEFAGLSGRANEAAQAAENALRGAADSGHEAAASAKAALEAALRAEKSLSALISHNDDPSAHGIFTGDRLPYRLTRNTTFYVRPDGNDNNDASANTPDAALKTPGGVLNLLRRTDQRGYTATVSLAAGTYPALNIEGGLITGPVHIASTDPLNQATIAGISSRWYAWVSAANLILGGWSVALAAMYHGTLSLSGNFTIKGTGSVCLQVANGGRIATASGTAMHLDDITCTYVVANSILMADMELGGLSFSGSAIGKRYSCTHNSEISTNYKGPEAVPGTVPGSVSDGGIYS